MAIASPSDSAAQNLSTLLLARADAEDLLHLSPADQTAVAAKTAEHLARRTPGQPSLRVEALPTGGTLVEAINDDMPFLLASVLAELNERGLSITLVAHPIFAVEREYDGTLIRLIGPATGFERAPVLRESVIHIHLEAALDAATQENLKAALTRIFADIRAAVADWLPMREEVAQIATRYRASPPHLPADEIAEAVQFLDWLLAENFTFLGLREYRFADEEMSGEPEPAAGLGILRDPDVKVLRRGKELVVMTPEIRAFMKEPSPLFVAKANVKSTIHRRVYLDYVGIKRFDNAGKLVSEVRLVGLFTSTAYTGMARSIPYLRHKIARVFDQAGFERESHSGKALSNVLESFPRDELFQVDLETLYRFAMDILALNDRPRLRVLSRVDRFDRFVSVIVFVPKDRYDTGVRQRIGEYLAHIFEGRVSAAYPAYPEGPLSRTHFIIGRTEGKTPEISRETLEADISAIVRTWADGFASLKGDQGWLKAFSAAYRDSYTPAESLGDIAILATLSPEKPFGFHFYRRDGEVPTRASLKVLSFGVPLSLSRRVPVIENVGFTVINERSFRIMPEGGPICWLHDMTLERASGGDIDIGVLEAPLEATLHGVFEGNLDPDRFNLLVVEAGLAPRQADILRAYARYLRQIGVPYGQIYIADALSRYPEAARMLARLFALRFDPARHESAQARAAQVEAARKELLGEIDQITSLDDDRIFRRMLNLIDATKRTNVYQPGRPTLAFKFACHEIDLLPLPRPQFEIFVASPQVEGLHLRFGKVARGGLRWSDRPMDFRTEVLGLVKAQQVKNAVIVPVGAKGGFVPKRLPPASDRDAWMAEGTSAYKTFINALLDLTDTILEGKIVPPANTLRYDEDDPYLVVAADKGTATFSDTANAISEARGHWLLDAFASGGSAGYDHKKMGITARGAWEAVKRHFREIDLDIQTQPFTVVGVGDMSGDVFGNGMLLSRQIRLLAAFDHRDIFIDPNPDAVSSFAERQRLFEKPRSSWADYDKALISEGGGVYSRALKKIPLSQQMRALLDLEGDDATPQAIMSAILKARADLLWFGGIGTYIRAETETDADAGDRANDAIRITGAQVRATVIGEGANLGTTQRGRIEAARAGVRLNTDAIDNSAGVNSSDVEVNLKIALATPEAAGQLTRADRNILLESMTEDVAAIVLRNNYLQSLALSLAQRRGVGASNDQIALMHALEGEARLDRKVEYLPFDPEIEARRARGEALTRPELAVLLAYAKLSLYDHLLASDVPDDPYLHQELRRYFPPAMRERFPDAIETHRLRREIVATQLSNAVINRGGPCIVVKLGTRSGRGAPDIARAYALARDVLGVLAINNGIDALDAKIPGALQLTLYAAAENHVVEGMRWFLANVDFAPGLGVLVERFSSAVKAVAGMESALTPSAREALIARREALMTQGVPEDLAHRISAMPLMIGGLDASLIAEKAAVDTLEAAATLDALFALLGLEPVLAQARHLEPTDPYERLALDRAISASQSALRAIAARIITNYGAGDAGVAGFVGATGERLVALHQEIAALANAPLTQARLSVLAGLLGEIAS